MISSDHLLLGSAFPNQMAGMPQRLAERSCPVTDPSQACTLCLHTPGDGELTTHRGSLFYCWNALSLIEAKCCFLQLPPVGFAGPQEAGEKMPIPHLQKKTANIRGWACSSFSFSSIAILRLLAFLSIYLENEK